MAWFLVSIVVVEAVIQCTILMVAIMRMFHADFVEEVAHLLVKYVMEMVRLKELRISHHSKEVQQHNS